MRINRNKLFEGYYFKSLKKAKKFKRLAESKLFVDVRIKPQSYSKPILGLGFLFGYKQVITGYYVTNG